MAIDPLAQRVAARLTADLQDMFVFPGDEMFIYQSDTKGKRVMAEIDRDAHQFRSTRDFAKQKTLFDQMLTSANDMRDVGSQVLKRTSRHRGHLAETETRALGGSLHRLEAALHSRVTPEIMAHVADDLFKAAGQVYGNLHRIAALAAHKGHR